jgi:hypothetical protein
VPCSYDDYLGAIVEIPKGGGKTNEKYCLTLIILAKQERVKPISHFLLFVF